MNIYYYLKEYLKKRPVFMALIRAKEAALYDQYKPYFRKPMLDVGCGDGEFAKMVWGQADAGIDLRESRMAEAIHVYDELKEFNGIDIPFKKNYFKTVVANCVLEHVNEIRPLLLEIYRVTRPGGYFLTTVMAKPWEDNLLGNKVLGQYYKKWLRKKQQHVNLLTAQEWRAMWKKTGWKVVKEIGYLPAKAAYWVEAWHYLSIGYLVSYKLTGKWTWVNLGKILPIYQMAKVMATNCEAQKSGAIFYVLEKTKE